MSAIARCPECQQQVSVPEQASSTARVRCPVCEAEYALNEAALTVPPELILVDVSATTSAPVDEDELETDLETLEWSGGDEQESDADLETLEAAIDFDGTDEETDLETSEEFDELESLEEVEDGFELTKSEPSEEQANLRRMAFPEHAANPSEQVAEITPHSTRPRRRSVVRQLVGIVGGGIVGLGLGYYLLLWIGGPSKDFLKVAQHLPPWSLPGTFQAKAPLGLPLSQNRPVQPTPGAQSPNEQPSNAPSPPLEQPAEDPLNPVTPETGDGTLDPGTQNSAPNEGVPPGEMPEPTGNPEDNRYENLPEQPATQDPTDPPAGQPGVDPNNNFDQGQPPVDQPADEPEQDPARDGFGAEPEQNPAEQPTPGFDDRPADEQPADERPEGFPGELPDETPDDSIPPTDNPGNEPADEPEQDPAEQPFPGFGDQPADEQPADEMPEDAPGDSPDQTPDDSIPPVDNPGNEPAGEPGQDPAGDGLEPEPGQTPAEQPIPGFDDQPADDQPADEMPEDTPGDSPAQTPDGSIPSADNPGDEPADEPGQDPASDDPGPEPGQNPGTQPSGQPDEPSDSKVPSGETGPAPAQPAVPLVRSAPTYKVEELDEALLAALESEEKFLASSLQNSSEKMTKVNAYRTLCRLAEVSTFAVPGETSIDQQQVAARDLMVRIAETEQGLNDVGLLGDRWLRTNRRDSRGAFLIGVVEEVQELPELYVTRLQLQGQPQVVTIVSREKPAWQASDMGLVLGTIVDNPAEEIVGYEGTEPQVIWAGVAVKRGS